MENKIIRLGEDPKFLLKYFLDDVEGNKKPNEKICIQSWYKYDFCICNVIKDNNSHERCMKKFKLSEYSSPIIFLNDYINHLKEFHNHKIRYIEFCRFKKRCKIKNCSKIHKNYQFPNKKELKEELKIEENLKINLENKEENKINSDENVEYEFIINKLICPFLTNKLINIEDTENIYDYIKFYLKNRILVNEKGIKIFVETYLNNICKRKI